MPSQTIAKCGLQICEMKEFYECRERNGRYLDGISLHQAPNSLIVSENPSFAFRNRLFAIL
jgi:hypothetical protein